jgi:hypothetical protein
MRRRLPYESHDLLAELTSWIEWRYANSTERLILTSAPTTLPSGLGRWMPNAVWRLAWLGSGAAILYGLAPGGGPTRYFVVQHDATRARREGLFDRLGDGTWTRIDGDALEPRAKGVQRSKGVRRHRLRRRPLLGSHCAQGRSTCARR